MRVQFTSREKFRLLGPNQVELVTSVHFSEIEKVVISTCDLERLVIIGRMPTIFKDFGGEWREIDNNIYLGRFLTEAHAEPVSSPRHAEAFKREILAALKLATSSFNHSTVGSTMMLHPEPA